MTKHPCISCIYFKQCGSTTRTKECKGRQTKSEKASKNRVPFYMPKIRKRGKGNE